MSSPSSISQPGISSLTDEARRRLAGDLFALEVVGAVIDEVRQGFAVCSLAVKASHQNARGVVMGGVTFTLADIAFAAAANSDCFAEGAPLCWTTLSSSVSFLAPACGPRLVATCQCVRRGGTTALYRTQVVDAAGTLVAEISATAYRLRPHEG